MGCWPPALGTGRQRSGSGRHHHGVNSRGAAAPKSWATTAPMRWTLAGTNRRPGCIVRVAASSTPSSLRLSIVMAAGTGLRHGEAMAVTVDHLDVLRRELRVDRQLWTPRAGRPYFGPPKTRRGFR